MAWLLPLQIYRVVALGKFASRRSLQVRQSPQPPPPFLSHTLVRAHLFYLLHRRDESGGTTLNAEGTSLSRAFKSLHPRLFPFRFLYDFHSWCMAPNQVAIISSMPKRTGANGACTRGNSALSQPKARATRETKRKTVARNKKAAPKEGDLAENARPTPRAICLRWRCPPSVHRTGAMVAAAADLAL